MNSMSAYAVGVKGASLGPGSRGRASPGRGWVSGGRAVAILEVGGRRGFEFQATNDNKAAKNLGAGVAELGLVSLGDEDPSLASES